MAVIRPFCAVRPAVEYADKVAALPYDVYNRAEAKKEVEREPLSFLAIDRAETQFEDPYMHLRCMPRQKNCSRNVSLRGFL